MLVYLPASLNPNKVSMMVAHTLEKPFAMNIGGLARIEIQIIFLPCARLLRGLCVLHPFHN
jgi:hypothetical protein